jgi:protein-L-isoaspartate(D-aspartate) O-methyltransferase
VPELLVDMPGDEPRTLLCDPRSPSPEALDWVYEDRPLMQWRQCADGETYPSTNSQPSLTGQALTALELEEGQRVLEVGAGTGYAAALLGHLVGSSGAVVSIDIVPDLVRLAQRTIAELGLSQVTVTEGDGALGYQMGSPYDAIVASVSLRQVPLMWLDQLCPYGRIVLPLRLALAGGDALVVLQQEEGTLVGRCLCSCGYQAVIGQQAYDDREALASTGTDSALESLLERERGSLDFIGTMVRDVEEAYDFQFWLSLHDDSGAFVRVGRRGRFSPLALLDPGRTTLAAWWNGETRVRFYGEPEARDRFLAGYERWTQEGRPRPSDLRVQALWNDPAADLGQADMGEAPGGVMRCRVWFERSS